MREGDKKEKKREEEEEEEEEGIGPLTQHFPSSTLLNLL